MPHLPATRTAALAAAVIVATGVACPAALGGQQATGTPEAPDTAGRAGFEAARNGIRGDDIRGHLYFLAHDGLAGRAPGTPGGDLAARYIASQFLRMGLEPVGDSYYQHVPVVGTTVDPATASLAVESADERLPAEYGDDAVLWPGTTRSAVQVNGELVFIGYGVDAPRWDWDDFKGRDLEGRVAVVLVGDPPAPPDEPELFDGRALTYYGRWSYKVEEAHRRGAAAVLIVHTAAAAGYDWPVVRSSWSGEQLALADDLAGEATLLRGWVTEDFARRALRLAGLDLDELVVQAARRDFRPVATGLTVRGRVNSRSREIRTPNVVGRLPGGHEARGDDVVVFTSHYDHLGIGPGVDGDSVYNGAYDNASGVAVLLQVAEAFASLERRPDRSLLFIATTAEEAGLLGARHYVAEPLVPMARTVAALNIDGANIWGETDDVIAIGGEASTLEATLAARAAEAGLTVRPDPAPQNGAFFRSDHFPFAQAGVPVLYLEHGLHFRDRPEGWGEEMMAEYLARRYHQPGDEYDPDMDLGGAVQQGRLLFSVGYDIANAEGRPRRIEPPAVGARSAYRPVGWSMKVQGRP